MSDFLWYPFVVLLVVGAILYLLAFILDQRLGDGSSHPYGTRRGDALLLLSARNLRLGGCLVVALAFLLLLLSALLRNFI